MKGLLGGIMLAAGILIAGLSGLCSVVFLASIPIAQWPSSLTAVLAFGGVPLLLGAGLIFAGRRLIRDARIDD